MLVILKPREARNELVHGTLRRKGGHFFEVGFKIQRSGDDFRCFPGANQGARQNRIERDVQTAKSSSRLAHSIDAFRG